MTAYNATYGIGKQIAERPSFGNAQDWATIISGLAQGASHALQSDVPSHFATNKIEAKEAKRRTLANLINKALRRDHGLYEVNQGYQNEIGDAKARAMQQVARGFVQALQS